MIKILYIHKLSDFQKKSAEVESVYIVRELKQKIGLPLNENKVSSSFSPFYLSESERIMMENTLSQVPITIEKVQKLLQKEGDLYEKVNLQRTIQILEAIPNPLFNNIAYAQNIVDWREDFVKNATQILSQLPRLKTREEKLLYNERLNGLFQKVLRNQELAFNYYDIINEKHISEVLGLLDGMAKGYFFHITLEEELKKKDFSNIKTRIPVEELQKVAEIEVDIANINTGVKKAYESNMRMVNFALILYSYVKWMMSP